MKAPQNGADIAAAPHPQGLPPTAARTPAQLSGEYCVGWAEGTSVLADANPALITMHTSMAMLTAAARTPKNLLRLF